VIVLQNGDLVQYDDPYYGKGRGYICGYREIEGKHFYAVHPKVVVPKDGYIAYLIESEHLIETPF
jgi:hypothetical protein